MCGIVGAIAERNVVPILMEGLRRLEYRGYDSAGIAVLNGTAASHAPAHRRQGEDAAGGARRRARRDGKLGIAHTRWATHGVPERAQRASAHLARRPRHRAQRHHREPRRAARGAEELGLRVHLGDRHRGDRASHPSPSGSAEGSVQGRARHRRRARRRLRARRRERSTTRSASSSRAKAARWSSASATTRTSSPPTSRRCCR